MRMQYAAVALAGIMLVGCQNGVSATAIETRSLRGGMPVPEGGLHPSDRVAHTATVAPVAGAQSMVPRPTGTLVGTASWYYNGDGMYAAAGPALRSALGDGWRGSWIEVNGMRVQLTDWCQCYGTRLIDLSRDLFAQIAPLSRGLVQVTVR